MDLQQNKEILLFPSLKIVKEVKEEGEYNFVYFYMSDYKIKFQDLFKKIKKNKDYYSYEDKEGKIWHYTRELKGVVTVFSKEGKLLMKGFYDLSCRILELKNKAEVFIAIRGLRKAKRKRTLLKLLKKYNLENLNIEIVIY